MERIRYVSYKRYMSNTNFRRLRMLSKERETGTILVYVKNFSGSKYIKTYIKYDSKRVQKKLFLFLAKPLLVIIQFPIGIDDGF